MKKWLALVLVLLMTLSMMALAGCGETTDDASDEEETLIGAWRAEREELIKFFEDDLGEDMVERLGSKTYPIYGYYAFSEDGTFKMYTDDKEMEDAFEDFRDDLIKVVEGMLDEPADGSGEITYRDIMESEGFSSAEEMVDDRFSMESVLTLTVDMEGEYTITDTTITVSLGGNTQELTYELDGKKLTLKDSSGDTLVFTKK